MKFLLLNQFFAPDSAPTGQLLADVAREIVARGHRADVVSARAVYAGAASGQAPPQGVRILHTPCLPFGHGARARLLSYASYYAGALWHSFRASDCDVVVTMTTPPLLSLVGTVLKKLCGVRHYIWEMDLYPDIAVALGMLSSGSVLARAWERVANYSRRNADGVILLGPCMQERVLRAGVPATRVHIAENWADGALVRPRPFPPPRPLVVLYSGNLGLPHDIHTIAAAIDDLKEDEGIRFVFAGGGARRRELEDLCRSRAISTVSWQPYETWERLGAHLAACHVGLVMQTPASLGTLVPGKIYALMAAGRPLLFIGPRQATAARIIERFGCGWQVNAGDSAGLVDLLRTLAVSPEMAIQAGARARRAFIANYDLPAGVSAVLEVFGIGTRRTPRRPAMSSVGRTGKPVSARTLSA